MGGARLASPAMNVGRARNATLLEQLALDPQSRSLAQSRITECDHILVQLANNEKV